MFDYDKDKAFQINQILHIVKIASLFFSAIAFFQYYFNYNQIQITKITNDIVVFVVLLLVLGIYVLWNFLQSKKQNRELITNWIEPSIFLVISFLSVILTGSYQSNYKFLFLFVIISASIECSMRNSMIISGISAAIILVIDLIFAPSSAINTHFESDLVLACAFMIISWTIGFYSRMEKQHIANLKELVNVDGLTGLYNHRYFYDSLSKVMNESVTNKASMSLLFIDIDFFKNYNDLNGHQKGDEVLRKISEILKSCTRGKDTVCRYGGEEFAVILPETAEKEALEVAERLRLQVQEQYFPGQEYLPAKNLTISVGISVYPSNAKSETELVKYADEALYRAKFLMKNRVEFYNSILDDLQNEISENDKEIITSIKTLIAVINARDKYTYKHVERVVTYCTMIADELHFNEQTKKTFIYAAYMHDIGKINIPQEILVKSTPLTDEEWNILKDHPKNGVEIIKNVAVLQDVIPIILHHHERYDGTGYPYQLKGNDISYLSRVLTVIDSFDAMTSNRPYQKKKTYAQAFEELIRCSGTQFDPEIVQQFIRIMKNKIGSDELI